MNTAPPATATAITRRFDAPKERRAHPRTTIVVDAACDLPAAFIKVNRIEVLPIRVVGPQGTVLDQRVASETQSFIESNAALAEDTLYTWDALPSAEIQNFLLKQVPANRDNLLQLTSSKRDSATFDHVSEVAAPIMAMHKRARATTNFRTAFRVWVMDTKTMLAGEGLLAYEAARQLRRGYAVNVIVQHLERVRKSMHTLIVTTHPRHIGDGQADGAHPVARFLGRLRSARRVTPILYNFAGKPGTTLVQPSADDAITRVLNDTRKVIERGLDVPIVAISYAGHLAELEKREAFISLADAAREKRIHVSLCAMSITGISAMGIGALSIAFASQFYPLE